MSCVPSEAATQLCFNLHLGNCIVEKFMLSNSKDATRLKSSTSEPQWNLPLPSSEHVMAVKSCLAIDIGNTFLAEMFSVLVAAETVALAVETLDVLLLMAPSKFISSVSESSE